MTAKPLPGATTARVLLIGFGVLVALIGQGIATVRPNWLIGVRTVWTLADPDIWERTHRAARPVLAGVGLLIIVAAALLPPAGGLAVALLAMVGAGTGLAAYSYLLWRRSGGSRPPRG